MISDGYGDNPVYEREWEEVLSSITGILQAHAYRLSRTFPAHQDDLVQEGRIRFWKTYHELLERDSRSRVAISVKAAKQRMSNLCNPTRHERMLGHASGTGTSEVKSVMSMDAPMSSDTETTFAETLIGAVDALAGVETAYHHGEILQALNRLAEPQREYVYLKFWRGYTDTEIAAMQGISTSGLYNRWARTIRPTLVEALSHLATV